MDFFAKERRTQPADRAPEQPPKMADADTPEDDGTMLTRQTKQQNRKTTDTTLLVSNQCRLQHQGDISNIPMEKACKEIEQAIDEYFEFNSTCGVPLHNIWDALKAVLRGKIISITSAYNKRKTKLQHDLRETIRTLEGKHKTTGSKKTLSIRRTSVGTGGASGAFGANLALEAVCWELLGRERSPASPRAEEGVLERPEGKPLRDLRSFALLSPTRGRRKAKGDVPSECPTTRVSTRVDCPPFAQPRAGSVWLRSPGAEHRKREVQAILLDV
ncbi:UNVERIFIED_CONTAM: hypothetical protein K2H54_056231 [Gekko kuhli]